MVGRRRRCSSSRDKRVAAAISGSRRSSCSSTGTDLLDQDRLDADIESAAFARRVDARLDQRDIFLEDSVLRGDPERQEPIEPALERLAAVIVDQFEAGHLDELAERLALELAAIE